MKLHHLRNATLILEWEEHRLLVDPMLGVPGTMPPLAFFRSRPRRNPLVPLPDNAPELLESVTAALITHCRFGHRDHLDREGARLMERLQVPVFCSGLDEAFLQRQGLRTRPVKPDRSDDFFGGRLTPFRTRHGYGLVGWAMGPGLGYLLEIPGEPSVYLSGDTVLTPTVLEVLEKHRPDVAVVAAGGARMDVGRPILMPLDEVVEFVRRAPGRVVANHLEALNHCPTGRDELRVALAATGFGDKTSIPEDGETLDL